MSTARALRRRDTMTRIVDAAQGIMSEDGLDALTMPKLAGRVGYAVGALYRYYHSKDAVIAAIQRRFLEEVGIDLDAALQRLDDELARAGVAADRAALERLAVLAEVWSLQVHRRPERFRLVSLSISDPREVLDEPAAARVVDPLGGLIGRATQLFEAAVEAGALAPGGAAERTIIFWSALQGTLQARKLSRLTAATFAAERLLPGLWTALLVGWGADPELVRQVGDRLAQLPSGSGVVGAKTP